MRALRLHHSKHSTDVNVDHLFCWSEVGDSQLIGPELVREMTEKIVQIKNRLLTAHSCQKSYADVRRKPMEFSMGDMQIRIPIVKGPMANSLNEFQNSHGKIEDYFKSKYPHLFSNKKKASMKNQARGRRSHKVGRM
ncbi:hypothetical protein Tco_0655441 [Tanacetum coccineum]|uniref:Reverse transcriptase domain-containing protein n=1 Tax=Tanacetum coccineum TaxID=301880 RepID=A0ABQ4X756_9ASTR